VNVSGPVPLVLDLHITHERWGSSSDPSINRHLSYRNDVDRSLNQTDVDKIRKYRADYNNNPPNVISVMSGILSTSGRLHREFVRLLRLQDHREFVWLLCLQAHLVFSPSGVQLVQNNCASFTIVVVVFTSPLKSKIGNILTKSATLRITLNIDDTPLTSRSHTHPSHS
jgi:hypothetical protein